MAGAGRGRGIRPPWMRAQSSMWMTSRRALWVMSEQSIRERGGGVWTSVQLSTGAGGAAAQQVKGAEAREERRRHHHPQRRCSARRRHRLLHPLPLLSRTATAGGSAVARPKRQTRMLSHDEPRRFVAQREMHGCCCRDKRVTFAVFMIECREYFFLSVENLLLCTLAA